MNHTRPTSSWRLDGEDLSGTDLLGAELEGASLWQADLRAATLERANLRRADLREAVLADARLTSAILDGADLTGANLERATLDGASLRGATLTRSNVTGASLAGTDVEGSRWEGVLVLRATWAQTRGKAAVPPAIDGAGAAAWWRRPARLAALAAAAGLALFAAARWLLPPTLHPLQVTPSGHTAVLGSNDGHDLPWGDAEALRLDLATAALAGQRAELVVELGSPGDAEPLYRCRFERALPSPAAPAGAVGSTESAFDLPCLDGGPSLTSVHISPASASLVLPPWSTLASSRGAAGVDLSHCLTAPRLEARVRIRSVEDGCAGQGDAFETVVPLCAPSADERAQLELQSRILHAMVAPTGHRPAAVPRPLSILLADVSMQSRFRTAALDLATARWLCDGANQCGQVDEAVAFCSHYHALATERRSGPDPDRETAYADSLYKVVLATLDTVHPHAATADAHLVATELEARLAKILNQPAAHPFARFQHDGFGPWDIYIPLINSARTAVVPDASELGGPLSPLSPLSPHGLLAVSSLEWAARAEAELRDAFAAATAPRDRALLHRKGAYLELNRALSWAQRDAPPRAVEAFRAMFAHLEAVVSLGPELPASESARYERSRQGLAQRALYAIGYYVAGRIEPSPSPGASSDTGARELVSRWCTLFETPAPCDEPLAAPEAVILALLEHWRAQLTASAGAACPRQRSRDAAYAMAVQAWLAWRWSARQGDDALRAHALALATAAWDAMELASSRDPGTTLQPEWSRMPFVDALWNILAAQMEELTTGAPAPAGSPSPLLSWHDVPDPVAWLQLAERLRGRMWFRPPCTRDDVEHALALLDSSPGAMPSMASLPCLSDVPPRAPDWSALADGWQLPCDLVYFMDLPVSGRTAVLRWPRGETARAALLPELDTSWANALAPWLTTLRANAPTSDPAAAWERLSHPGDPRAVAPLALAETVEVFVAGPEPDHPLVVIPSPAMADLPWPALPVARSRGGHATPLLLARRVLEAPDLSSLLRRPDAPSASPSARHLFVYSARRYGRPGSSPTSSPPGALVLLDALRPPLGEALDVAADLTALRATLRDPAARFASIILFAHHGGSRDESVHLASPLPLMRWLVRSLHLDDSLRLNESAIVQLGSRAELVVLNACSTNRDEEPPLDAPLRPIRTLGARVFRDSGAAVLGFRVEVPEAQVHPALPLFFAHLQKERDIVASFVKAQRQLYQLWAEHQTFMAVPVAPYHWSSPYLYAHPA